MKTITTKSGQTFTICTSRKEILQVIDMCANNFDRVMTAEDLGTFETSYYMVYADGSTFYAGPSDDYEVKGVFRRTGFTYAHVSDSADDFIYGDFFLYNMDDVSMTYSPEVDDEDIQWLVGEM